MSVFGASFRSALRLAALALGCASTTPPLVAAAAAAQPAESQAMNQPTAEQLLRSRAPGEAFEVRIEGKGVESFLKPVRCGYFEWIYGQVEGGKLVSHSVGYQSREPLTLAVGDQRVQLDPSLLRAYLAPSYEREYGAGEMTAPEVVKNYLAEGHPKAYVAEYCLELGRTYHALVHEDRVTLPPETRGQAPRVSGRRVLWLSDRPFVGGKPQCEPTPAYRTWTY